MGCLNSRAYGIQECAQDLIEHDEHDVLSEDKLRNKIDFRKIS